MSYIAVASEIFASVVLVVAVGVGSTLAQMRRCTYARSGQCGGGCVSGTTEALAPTFSSALEDLGDEKKKLPKREV